MKMIIYNVHVELNDENMVVYHQEQIDAYEVYEYILMQLQVLKQLIIDQEILWKQFQPKEKSK